MPNDAVLTCLTVDAPWAWAIVHGHKGVENRGWAIKHRGRLWIHASMNPRSDAAAAAIFAELGIQTPSGEELDALRGCVLGHVDVIDCVPYQGAGGDGLFAQGQSQRLRDDPFAVGEICWLLEHPVALANPPAIPGKQTLWTLPFDPLAP